jgi:hypothetical protein
MEISPGRAGEPRATTEVKSIAAHRRQLDPTEEDPKETSPKSTSRDTF